MLDRQQMLLAVTMGGGKTVISIAALEAQLDAQLVRRAVIVVPSMLKYQWQQEIQTFSRSSSLVIDGSPAQRKVLYSVAKYYKYVIINYEAVVNDWTVVSALPMDAIVIDEATYIKGFKSKRSRAVKKLASSVPIRYALTGQPVENRPEDLFSIMEFVDPSVFGHFSRFDRTFIVRDFYGRPIRYRNLKLLHKLVGDAMVRYSRADIQDQLPEVIESRVPVPLSRAEAKLYNVICDRLIERMAELQSTFGGSFSITAHYGHDEDAAMMRAQGEVMSMMLALRFVCDDARLLLDSARQYGKRELDDNGNALTPGTGSKFAWQLLEEGVLEKLPASSKLISVRDQITEALDGDPAAKVVAFSTFKEMLRYVQKSLPGVKSVIFDGDMNARQKDAAKQQFANDPETRLFLSSDAGGYGVNLNMANYLLSIDLPWSTGKMEQRDARIIRLSSVFEHVHLVATTVRGSIEDRMWQSLVEKKGVAGAFVDAQFDKLGRFDITLSSLTKFLEENTV